MDRLACVSVPAFELQLLIKRSPDWQDIPAAVISEAKPLGRVIAANRAALKAGVRPDMRYAQALSLRPDLQASVIPREERAEAQEEIATLLYDYAPGVESAEFAHATLFWLDVRGFSRLHSSYAAWAEEVLTALQNHGYLGACTVGFSRLGTFAASQKPGEVRVFDSPDEEARRTRQTAVRYLPIAPFVKERLAHLGVQRVEEFLALPKGGVRARFGRSVEGIYALSSQGEGVGVQGTVPEERNRARRVCMPSLRSVTPIVENVGELLEGVTRSAGKRQSRVQSVQVTLRDEAGELRTEELTPAEPTLDPRLLKKLCTLRLSRLTYREPVEEIWVEAIEEKGWLEQQDLFLHKPKRQAERGRKALSLLQARLGEKAILRAEIQDAHLPERRVEWLPFDLQRLGRRSGEEVFELPEKDEPESSTVQLVRRILPKAEPLTSKDHGEEVGGPFLLSSRWWLSPVEREYRYRQGPEGTLLWSYRNSGSSRWLRLGRVE